MAVSSTEKVQDIAKQLGKNGPSSSSPEELGMYSFLIGALYDLSRALELGFDDEAPVANSESLVAIAERVAQPNAVNGVDDAWRAGLYFNSAILRIHAVNARIQKHTGKRDRKALQVGADVTALKHDPDALVSGRTATVEDAIGDASQVVSRLSKVLASPS